MAEALLDYVTDVVEVSSTEPLNLDIIKALSVAANVGWVTCDDGAIYLQINDAGAPKVLLNADDVFSFKKTDEWKLKRIHVTTVSTTGLTVRYFFRYIGVKVMEASKPNES